jgi:DNA-binding NarL/FixJ family response regulator
MTTTEPPVLLVDDHVAIAQAMASALRMAGFERVTHVPAHQLDPDGILAVADAFGPEVALVDVNLGDGRCGVDVIGPLAARGVAVVGFTSSDDPLDWARCLEAGAVGVLVKSEPFDVIVERVRRAAAGGAVTDVRHRHELLAGLHAHRAATRERHRPFDALTAAERAVLHGLVAGRSPQEIAQGHGVAVKTVRSHVEAIRRKLDVTSQLAAVARAREVGWSAA